MTKKAKFFRVIFYISLVAVFVTMLLFCLFSMGLLSKFSSVKFSKNKLNYKTSVVAVTNANGEKISTPMGNNAITYDQVPQHTINAFVAIEDKDFFAHNGVNYKRMLKATLKNLKTMSFSEGASTISQQLIKNTHLTSEKTLRRKFDELILAKELEKNLSKQEILSAYLNAIYFGNGAFGINTASQRYFSKEAKELTLAESATLAGIIKSPKKYSPITNPDACIKRRNLVLKEMLKDGKISQEEYLTAVDSPLNLNINKYALTNNSYYHATIEEACELLHIPEKDLLLKNLKIVTYQDSATQKACEKALENLPTVAKTSTADGVNLVIDNKTGGVIAFCAQSEHNTLSLLRQPGSTIKPIVAYAPAIEKDLISPETPILDEPIDIDGYKPKNYKNKYHGWVSAKDALANSYNIPAVKLLNYVGIDYAKSFAQNLGLKLSSCDNGGSVALGGLHDGIKIKDLANCYQAFANGGKRIDARFIKAIYSSDGKLVYQNPQNEIQVMKSSTAYLISDMLKQTVESGTAKRLKQSYDICAKTGTVGLKNSQENSDAWNISYTPQNTVCVWVGSTSSTLLPKSVTGANAPSVIAQQIYSSCKLGSGSFEMPNSCVKKDINSQELLANNKLKLASENTPDRFRKSVYFAISNVPQEVSDMFSEISPFSITAQKTKKGVTINIFAKKYLNYTIHRLCEDNDIVVATVGDKQGLVEVSDNLVEDGNLYVYYAVATLPNDQSISQKSNQVKVFIPQKSYKDIINKWV